MTGSSALLLDTCAVIWLANGAPLPSAALSAIITAGLSNSIFVSPASAWELTLLSRPRPGQRPTVQCLPDPQTWFASFMAGPGIKAAPMTPALTIDAFHLPGDFHADPINRLIVATARHLDIPIVTSDPKILGYAAAGYIRVIPC